MAKVVAVVVAAAEVLRGGARASFRRGAPVGRNCCRRWPCARSGEMTFKRLKGVSKEVEACRASADDGCWLLLLLTGSTAPSLVDETDRINFLNMADVDEGRPELDDPSSASESTSVEAEASTSLLLALLLPSINLNLMKLTPEAP